MAISFEKVWDWFYGGGKGGGGNIVASTEGKAKNKWCILKWKQETECRRLLQRGTHNQTKLMVVGQNSGSCVSGKNYFVYDLSPMNPTRAGHPQLVTCAHLEETTREIIWGEEKAEKENLEESDEARGHSIYEPACMSRSDVQLYIPCMASI